MIVTIIMIHYDDRFLRNVARDTTHQLHIFPIPAFLCPRNRFATSPFQQEPASHFETAFEAKSLARCACGCWYHLHRLQHAATPIANKINKRSERCFGVVQYFSMIALRTHGLSSLSKAHVKSHCASFHLALVSTSPALFATWKHRKSIYGKIIQQALLSLLSYSLPPASSQSVPWPSGTASNVEDLWHIWHMWPLVTCRVESSLPCFNKGQLQSCSRNIPGMSNIFVVIYFQQMAAESQAITGNSRSDHFTPAKPWERVSAQIWQVSDATDAADATLLT